jgi:hypothetical protein
MAPEPAHNIDSLTGVARPKRSDERGQHDVARDIEALLEALAVDGIQFFPIRHHSPACAWHLRRWILNRRPAAVLVEGPSDFTPLIPLMLHDGTKPPFAVYTTFIDRTGRLGRAAGTAETEAGARPVEPLRFAAYYPLCDYSPELVALRAGRDVGARLRFIDLTFPEMVLAQARTVEPQRAPRVESLLAEPVFAYSEYVKSLAQRTGCRDGNELWDHLFEVNHARTPTDVFVRRLAAYCLMARRGCDSELLDADGTAARERAMAEAVREERDRTAGAGPLLVVTGGAHTAALAFLIRQEITNEPRLTFSAEEAQTALMRYSFPQLDALNGYASGMPSPRYYADLWQRLDDLDPMLEVAGRLAVEIGRLSREKGLPFALSAADEIAALHQARLLASFRGHDGPAREDLLDGFRSCFVKGPMDGEGTLLLDVVRRVLSGDQVGEVPPEAGVPPIVLDFRRGASAHRLRINDTVRKSLPLDIYRKARHRALSRFLRSLDFLRVPFAWFGGGPDFARGVHVERVQEHWEYAWSPATEAALIEASVYGSTVEEAAASRLHQAITELETTGQARSTAPVVRLLVVACQMGLHRYLDRVLALIERNVAEDPSFVSLVEGIGQLVLLWQSREPLEAHDLVQVPALAQTAYRRACALVPDLATTPNEQTAAVLDGLAKLREILAGEHPDLFDRDLLLGALRQLLGSPEGNATVAGAAAGVLFSEGALAEDDLLARVLGHLKGTWNDPQARTGFLQGLLSVSREVAWRLPGLLDCLTELFGSWGESEFVSALPHLRLAFATLTPKEADRVATLVAGRLGRQTLGDLVFRGVSAAEIEFNLRVEAAVAEVLEHDGLNEWARVPRQ